ncbi:MAG TPA: response regulator [Candidatus Cloacimonetes bacterium]|nr:response regulator [Candidatus Cloacimonadota bacterium]
MDSIKKNDRINNILFVDSDKILTNDLKDWAKKSEIESKYNLSLSFVQDAKSALKKMATMEINMIILEIVLPLINGYNLIKAIQKTNKEIPIIIYTSLKKPEDLAKMASYNVNNIFLKEFVRAEDLIEIARKQETASNIDKTVIELNSQIKTLHESTNKQELKLIQCPQCHLILAPDSLFCNNCGKKILRKRKKFLAKKSESDTREEDGETSTEESKVEKAKENNMTKNK